MTFEYRDAYGHVLTADHDLDDNDNPMAVLWSRGEYGVSVPVRIPASRVEEVVAGIRDAARTAAARQTTGQDDTACAPWTADGRHGPTPDEVAAGFRAFAAPFKHPAPAVGQPAEAHDTNRAAVLSEAADFIERLQDQMDEEIRAEYSELDRDTEVEGTATRRMAAELRRMAEEAHS